jgi:hypothetical protein
LAITAERLAVLHNLQGSLRGCARAEEVHGHAMLPALVVKDIVTISQQVSPEIFSHKKRAESAPLPGLWLQLPILEG